MVAKAALSIQRMLAMKEKAARPEKNEGIPRASERHTGNPLPQKITNRESFQFFKCKK